MSDAAIWNSCALKTLIDSKSLNLPIPQNLPGSTSGHLVPFHIIGNDAFALTTTLMKPYPTHINGSYAEKYAIRCFDYRLSRARRVVENAFGILSSRFRIFHTPIQLTNLETIDSLVLACVSLHNWLIKIRPREIRVGDLEQRQTVCESEFPNISKVFDSNSSSNAAREMREYLTAYFNGKGARRWQHPFILPCGSRKNK
jgi:hypothetical protein